MIIKRLRKYSFLSDKSDSPPYMTAKVGMIRKALEKYFDITPVGTVTPWARGTITRRNNDALFVDKEGRQIVLNRTTNPLFLYEHHDMRAAWNGVYGPKQIDYYYEPVMVGDVVAADVASVTSVADAAYVDASQCEYRDLLQQYAQVLEYIAHEIALQFPDRPADKLTYLDAGSMSGNCPNHPTHNGYPPRCLDIQYYTTGSTNYTQKGYPRMNVETTFDAPRNAMLVVLMAEAFPEMSVVLASSSRKQAMLTVYDGSVDPEWHIIHDVVRGDDTPAYNHDKHLH